MALAKGLIEVPALGGLNQELERWQPAPYTLLDNFHATKTGAVEKRRGMRRMSMDIVSPPGRSAGTDPWTTSYAVTATPTGELLTIGNIPEPDPESDSEKGPYMWSYSQSANKWLPKSTTPGTFVVRRPGIRGEASLYRSPTQTVLVNGRYEGVLYRDGSAGLIRIRDLTTGAVHTNNIQLSSSLGVGAAGKMVLLNLGDGLFTVVFLTSSNTQLRVATINPVTFSVTTLSVGSPYDATVAYWDAVPGSAGQFFIAAIVPSAFPAMVIRRVVVSTATVAASTAEFYPGPAGNVCGLAFGTGVVAAIWDTNANVVFRQYNATTLTPSFPVTTFLSTSVFDAGGARQVAAGYDASGRLTLLACGNNAANGDPGVWKSLRYPSGSLESVSVIPWCYLASKPFRIFSEQYVLVMRGWNVTFRASWEFGYALVHLGRHLGRISDNRPFSLEGLLAPFDSVSDVSSVQAHLQGPDDKNQGRVTVALHIAGVGVRPFGDIPRVWADVFEVSSGNFYWSDRLWRACSASGLLHLASSLTAQFDGQTLAEVAFLEPPQLAPDRTNPSLAYGTTGLEGTVSSPGTYTYLAHWEWLDAQGNLHRSRLSDPFTVTVAATSPNTAAIVTIKLTTTGLTRRGNVDESENSRPRVALYRTLNNGTVYYRCEATAYNLPESAWTITLVDQENDAQLLAAARGTIYTSGGILECETVPCARHIQTSGGRVWLTSSEAPEVWPSRTLISNEAPAFSPLLRISLDDAQTPLVGTAWLDGSLVIFSESRIYMMPLASGPSDAGEGAWPRPEEIQSSSGCVSAASILSYSDGVLYRDKDGFKLLTRSREVIPIGNAVRDYTDAFPETYDAVLDEANRRILILISNGVTGGLDNQGTIILVWDYGHRVWSTWSAFLYEEDEGEIMRQPWWYSRMALWKGNPVFTMGNQVLLMDLYRNAANLGLDNYSPVLGNQWVRGSLATPWVTSKDQFGRDAPLGGFFRAWRAVIEMDRVSAHGLKLSIYTDGEEATPSQIESWTSADIAAIQGLPRERLVVGIAQQKCMAIKLRLEDQPPAGPLPSDPQTGFRYHRTTLEVGVKMGVEKAEKANTR
jgi:hypothetical protein